MTRSRRAGRVLIDWSQNAAHKSTVCVLSLRARERPNVAAPLAWEELASPASLAFEAKAAGAMGAVVSGEDVRDVRDVCGPEHCIVVPGIRPTGSNGDDQARVLTPGVAIERGADYLVVGRPITEAPDPVGAARRILLETR
jgi:orotidine-5'-phosphate decarboxylase